MDFNEYQKEAAKTGTYPAIAGFDIVYPTLGLASEAGEVAGKIKKIFRDDNGQISDVKKDEIKHELGDVLWYLSEIARKLNIPLSEVATANIKKLESRKSRGVILGSGDNR